MKRLSLAIVLLGASASALAAGQLADVSVLDRDSGVILPTHYYHGEYWVAGRPGARYALRISSHSGERLLAVTAVDGVNAVSGETASFDQTGYVFAPWQSYDIAGWRKSDAEVAAFVFTAAPASYAARTGRPFNVGVIGVALFRERVPEPPPMPVLPDVAMASPPAAAPSGAAAPAEAAPLAANRAELLADSTSRARATAKLGTGHGEREYSWVQHTGFERRSSQPDEIIRIRYDSYENLVAKGVIRREAPHERVPQAFPDSPLVRYVPDPPLGQR